MSTEKQFLKPQHHHHHHKGGSKDYGATEPREHDDGPVAQMLRTEESGAEDMCKDNMIALADQNITLRSELETVFLDRWQLKVLLAAVPLALLGSWTGLIGEGPLFVLSFFGLIPLAALLGDFTEDVCKRTNEVIGALVNVTFGNATELIISICALRAGLLELIKFSLIGSILGNLLLVLGTAFLVGGLKFNVMRFNAAAANTYSPLLMLAVLSFVIPSGYAIMHESMHEGKRLQHNFSLKVSRQIAVVSCFVYIGYMFFQLYTHKQMFDDDDNDDAKSNKSNTSMASVHDDEEEEDEMPNFTWIFAILGTAVVSVLISLLSDILVDTVTAASEEYGLTPSFVGIIVIPIVGNLAEHATAIVMAAKGRMDVAVGVAMGSSIQIAAFVMPALVLLGWAFGVPLDMNFHPFLTALLFVSCVVASEVTGDGKTNWLEGLMLVSAYTMIAITTMHGKINVE